MNKRLVNEEEAQDINELPVNFMSDQQLRELTEQYSKPNPTQARKTPFYHLIAEKLQITFQPRGFLDNFRFLKFSLPQIILSGNLKAYLKKLASNENNSE